MGRESRETFIRALRTMYSLFSVEDKVVLITGAGQGMGAATAE